MEWEIASELGFALDPIYEMLKDRGIKDPDRFLYPKRSHLYESEFDPFKMQDMSLAATRIKTAIDNEESMLISGDYDADGVTSTATLYMGLEDLGAVVDYHIPQRAEGYGLSKRIVDIAHARGATLIITCDNGIVCHEEVEYAKTLGIDVVITDHHEPQETLPQAWAVVNPKRSDCKYPTKELAGCGVVFKLLQALNQLIYGDSRKAEKYLDIVCIGTVGDVMKLVGENRLITKYGLEDLLDTDNKGLRELLKRIKLDEKDEITVRNLGFDIVPPLNAVGRLYDPMKAVEMLIADGKRDSYRYAKALIMANQERQKLTEEWAKKIMGFVDEASLSNDSVMVIVYPEAVPEGLVGLISGKLKEKYKKPVILLTSDHSNPGKLKGSGRSIPGYDMFQEVLKCKSYLDKFGGHQAACGLSIDATDALRLRKDLNDGCQLSEEELTPKLHIDYEVEPEVLTVDFVEEFQKMKPFGNGNPEPLFVISDVHVQYPKAIGAKGNHLKFLGRANDENIDMIGWSMYKKWEELGKPMTVDVAFSPELNVWNNNTKVQLIMKDIRPAQ